MPNPGSSNKRPAADAQPRKRLSSQFLARPALPDLVNSSDEMQGKSDANVGVLQAAVNSTELRHNSFADPPIIGTTTLHFTEFRFKRRSLSFRVETPSRPNA